ncbi:MAG: hypothetical protein JWM00_281 [Candidatus Saccharibacteria bacterium]|nr:hypothetical protein [Candidatus Saccharibacteria bacterium]
MSILTRIQALGLPADQIIVIGSGLLDAYGLRQANDIDLVVTAELFAKLSASGSYEEGVKYGEPYLTRGDLEVWLSWGEGKDFVHLNQKAETIQGIMFVNPQFLIEQKRERGTEKDANDIKLLEEYLRG